MEEDRPHPATSLNEETAAENELDDSKSSIQEVEEDPFVKIELGQGLKELNEAMTRGESKEIRSCYTNLTKTFPTANLIWYSWAQYEYVNGHYDELEKLFTKCLKTNLSVPLWKLYLSYVKNHQLSNILDESEARQTMLKAYDFTVGHVGLDVTSGPIWAEYLEFTQSNYYKLVNENISTWEQQQLMDLTRKIYHRALLNPMEGLENLWHAYDSYENSLNKLTAKKLVAEKSSGYMAARSSTRELSEIIDVIDIDAYPIGDDDEVCGMASGTEEQERFNSWMKWIEWERKNPLTLANKPLLHSRIVYAYRRSLMSLRGNEMMWLSYSNYLRFDVNKPEDAELVLKQGRKCCPRSLSIVLATVDLKESRGSELEAIRPILDDFISQCENKLNLLKAEIIEKARKPSAPEDDDELIFENARIEKESKQVEDYCKLQRAFNGAQVKLLEVSRRIGGLAAGRTIFASARKSIHASSEIFSSAANLEFRIRKDSSIASKIYELGLNRFPTDWHFSREYLKFLLAQNDDGNIRALFERIISSIEGFRSTHSREAIELNEDTDIIKGIWEDFYEFEKDIGDYQSIHKLEERMRTAFPDVEEYKSENLFMSRLVLEESLHEISSVPDVQEFTMPKIRQNRAENVPFCLNEGLFTLLLKLNETVGKYDGPQIDPGRFISFIERVNIPLTDKFIEKEHALNMGRQASSRATTQSRRPIRRRRDQDDDDDDNNAKDRDRPRSKQVKNTSSSIFEDRRRN